MRPVPEAIETLPLVSFETGDVILREGEEQESLYFLSSGSVEVLKEGVRIAQVADKGAVFGEMSVFLGAVHTATVKAREASTFRVVKDPEAFLAAHPDVTICIATILASRLDSLNRYLVDVKSQFKDFDDHVGMLDEVLGSLMNKHPRRVERRDVRDPN